ncbi:MAG: ferrous iron transport protein B [Deltaproteobacteria bacterium]|nr:ferrous iron transport protein B [Deltaproteobacteria bacterium]
MTFNSNKRTLAEVEIGKTVRLAAPTSTSKAMLRLLEMGMTPGTEVELMRRGPFSDPLEVRLRGTRLSLRQKDAARFPVEELEDDANSLAAEHKAMTFAVVGNPNAGKTTLFNQLTGLSAHTGNYPGITVDHREGKSQTQPHLLLLDLPGTYSLIPRAEDEALSVRVLLGTLEREGSKSPDDNKNEEVDRFFQRPKGVVLVVDGSQLERNLFLAQQVREFGLPTVVVISMMDVLEKDGDAVDLEKFEEELGLPVFSRDNASLALEELEHRVLQAEDSPPRRNLLLENGVELQKELDEALVEQAGGPAFLDVTLLKGAGTHRLLQLSTKAVKVLEQVPAQSAAELAEQTASLYAECTRIRKTVLRKRKLHSSSEEWSTRVDEVLLHRTFGPIILVGMLALLFQALFAWSAPLMEAVEQLISFAGDVLVHILPESLPAFRSLWIDGVVSGVGNVLVFVPQIAILFFALGLLEDTGYLARAAFLLDRLMARVGLHGRAFVPLLSGLACAIPAVMATRTIENRKDRLITLLVTPLMSCSARLPVYTLMIATLFSSQKPLFGFLQVGTVILLSMYALSLVAALGVAAVFKRTLLPSEIPPLVLELPPYRRPNILGLLKNVGERVGVFIAEAGTVILAVTIVLWALFNFPQDDAAEVRAAQEIRAVANMKAPEKASDDEKKAFAAKKEVTLKKLKGEQAEQRVAHSAAGYLGRALQPIFAPLGMDWKMSVSVVASFAAREVLVSSLGLVYGLGDGEDDSSIPLRKAMQDDVHPGTKKPVHTPLSGLALMVFFVLAMQCVSTLAVVKRETGGWRWPLFQFAYMSVLAWLGAFIVYQGGRLLGFE